MTRVLGVDLGLGLVCGLVQFDIVQLPHQWPLVGAVASTHLSRFRYAPTPFTQPHSLLIVRPVQCDNTGTEEPKWICSHLPHPRHDDKEVLK